MDYDAARACPTGYSRIPAERELIRTPDGGMTESCPLVQETGRSVETISRAEPLRSGWGYGD